jgi:trimeric autotransporter adhesin
MGETVPRLVGLERGGFMRRYLALVFLVSLAIPAGVSISGCTRNPAANYCNGLGYGTKISDVYSIDLEPATTGISLAFGQTRQVTAPTSKTCKGDTASPSSYTYGTTDTTRKYVDISPTGNICAGSWNRNSGGGISDYTICSAPNPQPTTNGLPYTTAFITASADSVTSNPVEVYVHAAVSSINLSVGGTTTGDQCYSKGTAEQLDSEACYASGGKQYELCAPSTVTSYSCPGGLAPGVSSVPACSSAIGVLSYTVGTGSVATINSEDNVITANLPGTTAITATVAGSGASAGYFSTCPPKSISLAFSNGATSGTVTQGVTQNLTTAIVDTNNTAITGLSLDYQSTNPKDITVGSSGAITAAFPGAASVFAICQPSACNPAPVNEIGVGSGTGLPISSNAVNITTPGTASSYVWFGAPGASQYFVPISLVTGNTGSTIKLPYVPNSMVLDRTGASLYFGSSTEMMVYTASTNSLSAQVTSTPGVVLAVAPDNSAVLINDQSRKVLYVYSVASSSVTSTYGGVGNTATWTPDAKTLYVSDSASLGGNHTDTLYVYNSNTGWTTHDLSASGGAASLALTAPSVGAYLSGNPTVAHTWCPTGTAGNYSSMVFYPQGDSVDAQTDVLAGTTDGYHVIGAGYNSGAVTLSDIGVTIPTTQCPIATDGTMSGLALTHTLVQTPVVINATSLNQAVTAASPVSSGSSVASTSLTFLTYTGNTAGATLPYYKQVTGSTSSLGTLGYITLTGSSVITSPIAGAFSPDDSLFFVSTSGDNLIHYINTTTLTDTQQLAPALPACSTADHGCTLTTTPASGIVPATVIQVKPRTTT